MAASAQFQISAQANFIAGELLAWAQTMGGDAQVVSNLKDLWMQASQSSQKPIIYVCYGGETAWSSNSNISALTHRVSRNWIVAVKRGRGFVAQRGSTLSNQIGNAVPFYDAVEHIRDLCRAMLGISQDMGNDFAAIKPMSMGAQVIDAYTIEFSVKSDLPTIVMTTDEIDQ